MSTRTAVRVLLAALPIMLLWPSVRQVADARMSVLMLVEFPLLLASGWAWSSFVPLRARRAMSNFNQLGLASYTIALLVFSYWMIPAALDNALLDSSAYAARYATWLLAGFALGVPPRGPSTGVQIFFVGNAAWMAASAGLLYRESENRLCVNYLLQDQVTAGNGLVGVAVLMLALTAFRLTTSTGFRTA